MDQESPYSPPQFDPRLATYQDSQRPPTVMKVLGVLHVVFGGMGVLGLLSMFATPAIMSAFAKANEPLLRDFNTYQARILWVTVLSGIVTAIVTILIMVAGVKLLKGKTDSIAWSSRYSFASISSKILMAVITLVVVVPISQEYASLKQNPVTTVISSVLGMIYPILCLILLNRQNVRNWLALNS